MTIAKRKPTRAVVEAGREIDDARSSIAGIAFHRKRGVIDAVRMFIQKDKQLRCPGNTHIGLLHVGTKCRIGQPLTGASSLTGITPERLAHGNTAHTGYGVFSNPHDALVRRAFEDFCVLQIFTQQGPPIGIQKQALVRVGRIAAVEIQSTWNPDFTRTPVSQAAGQKVVVVSRIHQPGKDNLLVVAHATDPASLGLGLG